MNPTLIKNSPWGEIPTYEYQQISAKKNPYCVLIFVINEGQRIQTQLKKMADFSSQVDIIICDGGSTDGSLSLKFLKEQKVTALLTKKGSGKLSAQMRMGFDFALSQEYQGVIVMDGNNKDNPVAIPTFIKKLNAGYDHIQGSRFVPGGKEINTPILRKYALHLIHAPLIAWRAKFPYTDTTNGFRAYSRKFLTDPNVNIFRGIFRQYEAHYYLAIRAADLGHKITEIPVERAYPKTGKTPTKISFFRGNWLVLKTLFKAITNQYHP